MAESNYDLSCHDAAQKAALRLLQQTKGELARKHNPGKGGSGAAFS
jgi:hypothetical protein